MPYVILFLLLTLADQYTKLKVQQHMFYGQSIPILDGIFHLTYVQNTGGAFGILRNRAPLFIIASVIIIFFMIYILLREGNKGRFIKIIFTIILAGAVSNLIDRVRLGYVVDFLDFMVWPVFNIADASITVGMILLLLHSVLKKEKV